MTEEEVDIMSAAVAQVVLVQLEEMLDRRLAVMAAMELQMQ